MDEISTMPPVKTSNVLIVLRDSILALELRKVLREVPNRFRVLGVVDPKSATLLEQPYAAADALIVGGEEWQALWRKHPDRLCDLMRLCAVVVLTGNAHLIDILSMEWKPTGLVVKPARAPLAAIAISVALEGNAVIAAGPFELLRRNSYRRAIASGFEGRELAVMQRLGRGEPNDKIAWELGLAEGEIKIVVATLMRRLRLPKRLTLAVFAGHERLNAEKPDRAPLPDGRG